MNAPNLHPLFADILKPWSPPPVSRIENRQIAELADALATAAAPTAEEIHNAMELAYKMGRVDGSLASCKRVLNESSAA